MIQLKNAAQIEKMKEAGRITGEAIILAGEAVREGVTTKHLDDIIRHHIEKCGARPTFLGYGGFPGSACISVNDQVIHGIPSADVVLKEGDIVKIDVGATYHGFVGDSANTFGVGRISPEAQALIDCTRNSFYKGAEQFREGNRIGDIGHAVQKYCEERGYGVIRKYVGHGVGRELHEAPDVPNYGTPGRGPRLVTGMTIAIEPMVSAGSYEVRELRDGWTVVTADGSLTAHYEHSVALTEEGVIFLTRVDSSL
ncbi:MAG: type I methionyl aminopeptidase [Firmicutes bacterium]|jgi:methionyl aminopeptidase|uniref:Methionine aminopeptidase n=1 Tax=Candidatus Colimorpha enterica TaxID=3083063 RepID=R6TU99_9BACT|nr:type I methionyl aminopeptidase [Candidatus Colimorpha enterica]MCI5756440.1 type I methionyl aminopeptidase [Candidatus Colimorpha enterica]CDC73394.1 methionine aminopeptidase [Candidatus Colimorpha enterica]